MSGFEKYRITALRLAALMGARVNIALAVGMDVVMRYFSWPQLATFWQSARWGGILRSAFL
jgi:hypothetical protein